VHWLLLDVSLSLSRNNDGIFPRGRFGNIKAVQIYELDPRVSHRFEDYSGLNGEDMSERKNGDTYCLLRCCMIRIYSYS
jgi:hypothetical protein